MTIRWMHPPQHNTEAEDVRRKTALLTCHPRMHNHQIYTAVYMDATDTSLHMQVADHALAPIASPDRMLISDAHCACRLRMIGPHRSTFRARHSPKSLSCLSLIGVFWSTEHELVRHQRCMRDNLCLAEYCCSEHQTSAISKRLW